MRRNKLQHLLGLKFEAIKKEGAVEEKRVVVFSFICTKKKSKFRKSAFGFKSGEGLFNQSIIKQYIRLDFYSSQTS